MGFGVGAGFVQPIVGGATLLFVTNLAAIMAMAFVTFLVVGMDTVEVRRRISVMVSEQLGHDRPSLAFMRTALAKPSRDAGARRARVEPARGSACRSQADADPGFRPPGTPRAAVQRGRSGDSAGSRRCGERRAARYTVDTLLSSRTRHKGARAQSRAG